MAWEPDYVDVAVLAAWLGINDDEDDAKLELAISAASRNVDEHCSGEMPRQFGRTDTAETRSYRTWYNFERQKWVAPIDDLIVVSGTVVTADGTETDDYTLEPSDAPLRSRPYEWIEFLSCVTDVTVTEVWGWPAIPKNVQQATLLEAARVFARKNAPFGIAGSPDQGSEMRLLARMDPDAVKLLRRFKRLGGVG